MATTYELEGGYILENMTPGELKGAYILENMTPGELKGGYILENMTPGELKGGYILENMTSGELKGGYILENMTMFGYRWCFVSRLSFVPEGGAPRVVAIRRTDDDHVTLLKEIRRKSSAAGRSLSIDLLLGFISSRLLFWTCLRTSSEKGLL